MCVSLEKSNKNHLERNIFSYINAEEITTKCSEKFGVDTKYHTFFSLFFCSTILDENYTEVEDNKRYSMSKARKSLSVPKNVVAELDENKIFELKEVTIKLSLIKCNTECT